MTELVARLDNFNGGRPSDDALLTELMTGLGILESDKDGDFDGVRPSNGDALSTEPPAQVDIFELGEQKEE